MDKQYKNLMDQQNISPEVTAQFCDKLEQTATRRKSVRWKAVLAAACVALMIPLTAFAAKSIFGTPKVKLGKLDWYDGPNGYSVRFENVDSFPLEAFPEEVQAITEYKMVVCDSWEAAEETLGIDLLNNSFLAGAKKKTMSYKELGSDYGNVHSMIRYSTYNDRLCFVGTMACYQYNGVQLDLKAKITVEHSDMDEEMKQVLHGMEGAIIEPSDTKISYEEYITKEGIPVVIVRFDRDLVVEYSALFSVNDISYEVTVWCNPGREDVEKQILLGALDGFQLG